MLRAASLALAISFVISALPGRAHAARILFVSDAGADTGIAEALRADGHEVEVVLGDFASGNARLRAPLDGIDAVFWSASGSGSGDVNGDAELYAHLEEYVSRGGRVLVTGYDSVASPTDPMLIVFLGASGSTDVPPAPGPITNDANSLTTGVVDIRGWTPMPSSSDRDTLTGLQPGTIEVAGTAGGAAGAQWTLRALGAGEIAYVSNGDSGSGSTATWTNTAMDGSGAYNAAIRNFASRGALPRFARTDAPAGAAHPRRARVMTLMSAAAPAILVGPDRAWMPTPTESPLSLCAGSRCAPVLEVRFCEPPRCPGSGALVIAAARIADVDEWPTGRAAWGRERSAVTLDPELSPLAPYLGAHPEPSPVARPARFLREPRDWLQWEARAEIGAAYLAGANLGTPHVALGLGLRFQGGADDDLAVMYGTMAGFDVTAHVFTSLDAQRPESVAVLVGIAPALTYAFPRDRVRIPPAFGWIVPEVGVAMRTDRPGDGVTAYLGWALAAAFLLDDHVGLDLRARVLLVPDWVDGDTTEAITSIAVGLLLR